MGEGADECPMCEEKFAEDDEVKELTCKHTFHAPCIDSWLRTNKKCPLCRADP